MTFIKRTICFVLLSIAISNVALAQFIIPLDFEYPLSSINKGVKKITEETRSGSKTISKFDTNGFLTELVYYYRNNKIGTKNFTYSTIGDSILTINNNESIYKYYFSYNKNNLHYTNFGIYSLNTNPDIPFVVGHDFIYIDSILNSYIRNNDTIRYTYSDIGQVIKREKATESSIESTEYIYDKKNILTDMITINNPRNSEDMWVMGYLGGITYSEDERNKYQYHFDDFDERNNWTKRYCITKDDKILWSERKIIYY